VAAIDARTGEAVRLFHPRLHRWPDHFRLYGAIIEPVTQEGEMTARLLRFNQAERIVERTTVNGGALPAACVVACGTPSAASDQRRRQADWTGAVPG